MQIKYVTCGTHNCLSTYLQRDKCSAVSPACRRTVLVSTGSLRASPLRSLYVRTVPVQPVCSGAPLSCYMGTHSVARSTAATRGRAADPGPVNAASSSVHTSPSQRASERRRQVVNLPRFEAPSAQLDVRTADPRRDPVVQGLHTLTYSQLPKPRPVESKHLIIRDAKIQATTSERSTRVIKRPAGFVTSWHKAKP